MELFLNLITFSLYLTIFAVLGIFCVSNLPEDNPGHLSHEDAVIFAKWCIVPGFNVVAAFGVAISFALAFLNLFFTDKDDDDDMDGLGF